MEYKNLELILVGTQRENEKSMAQIEQCVVSIYMPIRHTNGGRIERNSVKKCWNVS